MSHGFCEEVIKASTLPLAKSVNDIHDELICNIFATFVLSADTNLLK